MQCFKHPERQAVGICKACSKGLCPECGVDLDHGLACRGKHEEMVETYNMLVSRNAKLYGVMPRGSLVAPVFYAGMGLLFVLYSLIAAPSFGGFLFVMGVGFFVFGVVVYRLNKRAYGGR